MKGRGDIYNKNFLPQDGVLEYTHSLIEDSEADSYFEDLKEVINWSQDSIRMYGRVLLLPRLTAWYGDSHAIYEYSGIKNIPLPWNPILLHLKEVVEKRLDYKFNSVLLNFYRNHEDHMSWHSDNEAILGDNPTIASLSFGCARKFQVKHKFEKRLKILSFPAEHGSLFVMRNEMQDYWNHRIAKTKMTKEGRINLTFRNILIV